MPCKDLVEHLKLSQKECDGYFCTDDGTVIAFDSSLINQQHGLIIRKDYLEKYLSENGMEMFWICTGEKQFFKEAHSQIWSDWLGVFSFVNGAIEGSLFPEGK